MGTVDTTVRSRNLTHASCKGPLPYVSHNAGTAGQGVRNGFSRVALAAQDCGPSRCCLMAARQSGMQASYCPCCCLLQTNLSMLNQSDRHTSGA